MATSVPGASLFEDPNLAADCCDGEHGRAHLHTVKVPPAVMGHEQARAVRPAIACRAEDDGVNALHMGGGGRRISEEGRPWFPVLASVGRDLDQGRTERGATPLQEQETVFGVGETDRNRVGREGSERGRRLRGRRRRGRRLGVSWLLGRRRRWRLDR